MAHDRDANATLVADVMTPGPRTTTPQSSLANAFGMMIDGSFRYLPVVGDDDQVIAMRSMRDIPPEYRLLHQRWREWTNGPSATMAPARSAPRRLGVSTSEALPAPPVTPRAHVDGGSASAEPTDPSQNATREPGLPAGFPGCFRYNGNCIGYAFNRLGEWKLGHHSP